MPSYKKPNMSSINSAIRRAQSQANSAIRKLESENRQFQSQARRSISELKSLERQTKSYQTKLRSSSTLSIPMTSMPTLYLGTDADELPTAYYGDEEPKTYDVFISHASEDKDEVARPLAEALERSGLRVWYDEFELRIGDSLRRKIDKGIANSNFGVIVISRSFIKKGWTNYELDGMVTRSVDNSQQLLPVWHDITKREVMDYSASLADKLARSTTEFTVEEIADEISDLIIARKEQNTYA